MANSIEYLAFPMMLAGCLIAAGAASLLTPNARRSTSQIGDQNSVTEKSLSAIHSLNYIIMLIWIAFATGVFGMAAGAGIGLVAMLLIAPSSIHDRLATFSHRFDRGTLARDSILAAAVMLTITLALLVWPDVASTLRG